MTTSILAYASYVPAYRLGSDSGVRGNRAVASFDENSTTMAVAAARALPADELERVDSLWFATTSPAYLDKTNASAIHAALQLPPHVFASDLIGSGRSTAGALRAASAQGGLVLAADVRVGKPGSSDEKLGGDGAAAFVLGEGPGVADVLASTSTTGELLDRWRVPTSVTGEQWEERFGFERYAELVRTTVDRVLAQAGVDAVDHVVLASGNSAVVKRAGALVKGQVSTVTSPLGFSGASDLLVALAHVLDRAEVGQTILLVSAVDGADVWLLRTTDLLPARRQPVPLERQLADGVPVPYPTYLSWRGLLAREMPRRPEPERPAGPPSLRGGGWKFGFVGARCTQCGFVHLPPVPVCRSCGASQQMEPAPVSRLRGRVATYTVDRLAYSPSPPVVDVVVDFDDGGRCAVEVADADPASVEVGTEVEMTFRSLFVAGGVHNYFWKAKVVPTEAGIGTEESA
ncbi:OB-fold domain-containing protein [Aeromicrobium alkaliterrae]|uniref:3-oxoacyl-[acyl-carrier-protein] synthase III C-terminal domain-containing protein n=1 Tax=Aeromicrobium alkaliterrae TaxID=302168 RepID=A0ABP4WAQ0_9ACTN